MEKKSLVVIAGEAFLALACAGGFAYNLNEYFSHRATATSRYSRNVKEFKREIREANENLIYGVGFGIAGIASLGIAMKSRRKRYHSLEQESIHRRKIIIPPVEFPANIPQKQGKYTDTAPIIKINRK